MKTKLITLALLIAASNAFAMPDPDTRPDITQWANEATPEQLEEVKGIGPVLAARIIAGRPHKDVQSVVATKGIGEVLAHRIADHVETIAD